MAAEEGKKAAIEEKKTDVQTIVLSEWQQKLMDMFTPGPPIAMAAPRRFGKTTAIVMSIARAIAEAKSDVPGITVVLAEKRLLDATTSKLFTQLRTQPGCSVSTRHGLDAWLVEVKCRDVNSTIMLTTDLPTPKGLDQDRVVIIEEPDMQRDKTALRGLIRDLSPRVRFVLIGTPESSWLEQFGVASEGEKETEKAGIMCT